MSPRGRHWPITRWRWIRGSAEVKAFTDLYRFLRWRADPDRRVASEAELLDWVGAWIGSVALGERIGRAMVSVAPVTVRVLVPAGAEILAFWPWELTHVDGVPLAARCDVALIYDLPGANGAAKAPVALAGGCRMDAVHLRCPVTPGARSDSSRYPQTACTSMLG